MNDTANPIDCDKNESVVKNNNKNNAKLQLQNVTTTTINSSSSPSYFSKNNKIDQHNEQQQQSSTTISTNKSNNATIVPNGYLIYGPECKIPDIDPLAKDVMKLFHKEDYRQVFFHCICSYIKLVVYLAEFLDLILV